MNKLGDGVIVLDADEASRRALLAALEAKRFGVVGAEAPRDVHELLAASPKGTYRLVVAEVSLATALGLHLVPKPAPFVMLTGHDATSLLEVAQRVRAVGMFVHPIRMGHLVAEVEELVRGRTTSSATEIVARKRSP